MSRSLESLARFPENKRTDRAVTVLVWGIAVLTVVSFLASIIIWSQP